MLDRKEETKIVKTALVKEGYQDIKVSHGRGTAWGWLDVAISVPRPAECHCDFNDPHRYPFYCDACREVLHTNRLKITDLLLETTGRRRGEYDGNTIVDVNFIEITKPIPEPVKAEPIPYTTRETRRDIRANRAARANDRITKRNGTPLYY